MATQMTTAFTINNGTIDLAFSSLCEKAPSSNAYDAGKYCTTLCIKKGSKDEADFISGYNATAAEAMAKFGLQIPPVQSILKDGDAYNAKRLMERDKDGNTKKAFEVYTGSWFIKISSKYPIRLYDIAGVEKKAFGPNSMPIKDGNCDTYFIPNIDGSKVNISIKFNVGTGFDPKTKQAYSYARPYLDWIQQITPGASHSVGFSAPTAWTGAVPQVQPQMAAPAAPTQFVPQQTMPQYQAPMQQMAQPSVAPQVPVQQYQAPVQNVVAAPQVQPQMAPVATPSQPILNDTDFAGSAADLTLPFEF